MRTRNAFFFSRKEQTAQCLWSRHVKRKLCRRIQSSSTSNSMCLGKLCLKSARKQGFPSTKNGPLQGMLRLQLLPGWRYDLWKQAAQALLLKRRCGKGEWDWKDGWWVTHTHTPTVHESSMLSNSEMEAPEKTSFFFAGTISTFAERYTILCNEGWSINSDCLSYHPYIAMRLTGWLAVFVRNWPMSMLPDCWNSKTVD